MHVLLYKTMVGGEIEFLLIKEDAKDKANKKAKEFLKGSVVKFKWALLLNGDAVDLNKV